MKAEPDKKRYRPLAITIEFETKEELQAFYAMCSTAAIREAMGIRYDYLQPVRDAIVEANNGFAPSDYRGMRAMIYRNIPKTIGLEPK